MVNSYVYNNHVLSFKPVLNYRGNGRGICKPRFCCFRWKTGRVCRNGRFCTFAHGQEELRSWRDRTKEDCFNKSTPTRSEGESFGQTTEKDADISRTEVV